MNQSKTSVALYGIFGTIKSIVGYGVAIFSILGLLGFLISEEPAGSDHTGGIIMALFFLAFGTYFIISGAKLKRLIKRFKRYVGYISHDHMMSFQDLAFATRQTTEFVIKDIQMMIDKKFFVNAWLDLNRGEIILGNNSHSKDFNVDIQSQNQSATKKMDVVQCSGCGASNTVEVGKVTRCEFCDTALRA